MLGDPGRAGEAGEAGEAEWTEQMGVGWAGVPFFLSAKMLTSSATVRPSGRRCLRYETREPRGGSLRPLMLLTDDKWKKIWAWCGEVVSRTDEDGSTCGGGVVGLQGV